LRVRHDADKKPILVDGLGRDAPKSKDFTAENGTDGKLHIKNKDGHDVKIDWSAPTRTLSADRAHTANDPLLANLWKNPEQRVMMLGTGFDGMNPETSPSGGEYAARLQKYFKELAHPTDPNVPATKYFGFEFLPQGWEKNLDLMLSDKPADQEAYKKARAELVTALLSSSEASGPTTWSPIERMNNANRYVNAIEAAARAGLEVIGIEKPWTNPSAMAEFLTKPADSSMPDIRDPRKPDETALELFRKFVNADSNESANAAKNMTDYMKRKGMTPEDADALIQDFNSMKEQDPDKFKALANPKYNNEQVGDEFNYWYSGDRRNKIWKKVIEERLGLDKTKTSRLAILAGFRHFNDPEHIKKLGEILGFDAPHRIPSIYVNLDATLPN